MNSILLKCLVPAALLGTMMAPIAARADDHNSVNDRLHRQHVRIEQGERSGALTGREAGLLERRDARLHRQEHRMRQSGDRFTPSERARLQREENRSSHAIYRQKHDRQER